MSGFFWLIFKHHVCQGLYLRRVSHSFARRLQCPDEDFKDTAKSRLTIIPKPKDSCIKRIAQHDAFEFFFAMVVAPHFELVWVVEFYEEAFMDCCLRFKLRMVQPPVVQAVTTLRSKHLPCSRGPPIACTLCIDSTPV